MGILNLTSILLLMDFHEIYWAVGKQMFTECVPFSCQLVKNPNKLMLLPSFLLQQTNSIDVQSIEEILRVGILK